jgi:sugar phosphate isomerase/epimerase
MKNKYGLQLYSIRDITENDLASSLERVAALGYDFVEFAGFFDHSAEDVKAMLANTGLTISGTHSPLNDLRPTRIMETVKFHSAIGNPNYIVPGADLSTLEKIKDFCSVMNYARPILEAEGIKLGYHNHSHEFALMPWGSTIHSEIERNTDIEFEIDTYWAYKAGIDPVEVMDRLKNRISVIHIKDGFADGRGMPLGEGEAPVSKVYESAIKHGFKIVVESETLTPSGIDEAERCIKYLRSIEK